MKKNPPKTKREVGSGGWGGNSLIRGCFENAFALQIRKMRQRTLSYLLPLAVISSFSQRRLQGLESPCRRVQSAQNSAVNITVQSRLHKKYAFFKVCPFVL